MVDFSKLKNSQQSSLEKLSKKLEEQSAGTNSFVDERYWRPTLDKAGNGSALIRLLPTPAQDLDTDDDATPFVKYYEHNFQGPGGWYIERCLTTLGTADPCAEYNSKLWRTNIEANQNIARNQGRRLRIVSNIQVVSDPGNPDNDGKIFLFRYGSKLMEKFQIAMKGDEDVSAFNPWDFWEGANFRLKIKTVKDKKTNRSFPNYEDSKFAPQSSLSKDDNELQSIWVKEFSLLAEVAPDKFKSYAELQAQLNRVLARPNVEPVAEIKEQPTAESTPVSVTDVNHLVPWHSDGDDADTTLAMFEKLANG